MSFFDTHIILVPQQRGLTKTIKLDQFDLFRQYFKHNKTDIATFKDIHTDIKNANCKLLLFEMHIKNVKDVKPIPTCVAIVKYGAYLPNYTYVHTA